MTVVKEAIRRTSQDPRTAYEQSTVLALGSRGMHHGRSFRLVGRTCVRGRRGALWNEWLLRFDDDHDHDHDHDDAEKKERPTIVLAESWGGGVLMIYEERSPLPAHGELVLGGPIDTGFIVVERGRATRIARWGEVEDSPTEYLYADLSSRSGTKATIEYLPSDAKSHEGVHDDDDHDHDTPHLFVGKRLTLAELGLDVRPDRPRFLPVPELSRPKGVTLWLEIGDEGELMGAHARVIGALRRSHEAAIGEDEQSGDAPRSAWDEYLLHDPRVGFRWLIVTSDGHWNLVEHIEAGVVDESESMSAWLDGTRYEHLSEGTARMDWATGELPWEVTIGETVHVKDFVSPPWILTKEWSADEVSWSRGTHLDPDAVAKAFGKRALPKPIGRAPNQPR